MVIFIYSLYEPQINWEIDFDNIKLIKHILHTKLIICSYVCTDKLLSLHLELQIRTIETICLWYSTQSLT